MSVSHQTREAQEQGPPACYSLHREEDDRCNACEYVERCKVCTRSNRARRTLREAVDAQARAANAVASATPETLVHMAQAAWGAAGGVTRGWGCDVRWMRAAEQVVAACAASGVDPRVYMEAQLSMMVPFCRAKRFPLKPGMLIGPKAAERFRAWAERERKASGHAIAAPEVQQDADEAHLAAGEREFALRYLQSPGMRAKEVEAEVQREHPSWSLAKTASMTDLRLQAFCGAAAAIDPTAPDRLLVPADGSPLGWPEMRRAVLGAFALEDPLA